MSASIMLFMHQRDMMAQMLDERCVHSHSLGWLRRLRYAFDEDQLIVSQGRSSFKYGYEYLGSCQYSVCTPLTDRVWLATSQDPNCDRNCDHNCDRNPNCNCNHKRKRKRNYIRDCNRDRDRDRNRNHNCNRNRDRNRDHDRNPNPNRRPRRPSGVHTEAS